MPAIYRGRAVQCHCVPAPNECVYAAPFCLYWHLHVTSFPTLTPGALLPELSRLLQEAPVHQNCVIFSRGLQHVYPQCSLKFTQPYDSSNAALPSHQPFFCPSPSSVSSYPSLPAFLPRPLLFFLLTCSDFHNGAQEVFFLEVLNSSTFTVI